MTSFETFMCGVTVGAVLTWLAFIIGEWRSRPKLQHCNCTKKFCAMENDPSTCMFRAGVRRSAPHE